MSEILAAINRKRVKTAIGLLSGTSVDGIDAVLLQIEGSGIGTKVKILDFETYRIPDAIKKAVLKNSDRKTARIDEICRLNVILGELFAGAAKRIIKKSGISGVDFIGSHGQTIHHLPDLKDFHGYKVKSTLQIGDPSVIANLTGITTVGDFRVADCAVGGDGAPLVPYLDYILFRSSSVNRALLNIGGIANITVIPRNCSKDGVFAFDTGPGNMIIDGLMQHLFRKGYDKNGAAARSGGVDEKLFKYLLSDKYFKRKPPKSTGRERYGEDFQGVILKKAGRLWRTSPSAGRVPRENIIRTVTEFTAYSIKHNYDKFIKPRVKIDELIVSGGGSRNPVIMESLKSYFKGINVREIDEFGITSDSKEAVLFAVLANECIAGNAANMKSAAGGATGSKKDVILGKICLA